MSGPGRKPTPDDEFPLLSAVLGAPAGLDAARLTIEHLARQTIAGQMELIVVACAEVAADAMPPSARAFAAHRVVVAEALQTAAAASAVGARAARAPLVVLCEDHCFPDPDWAAELVEAHATGRWAAVAPVFANANPDTAVSRADFLMGYGPWMEPQSSREAEFLPGHNSCYRRDVLLAQGEALETCLEAEAVFHQRLRAAGQRLRIAAGARVSHTNFSRVWPWLRISGAAGRLFAARRAAGWTRWRRLAYVGGSPLIPAVRLARTLKYCRRSRHRLDPATLGTLLVGLAADTWGQLLGYATGKAGTLCGDMDFGRQRFLTDADRRSLARRLSRMTGPPMSLERGASP